ncbi:MAG TPA: SOS response-associated peptidase, partial [Anaerolineales bacterium]|nr:SOS response-associated peptidase [Anaerolineales bacterium]
KFPYPYSKIVKRNEVIMCGRFTLTIDPYHLQEAFPWAVIPDDLQPRYNIAPSQPVAVIPNTGDNTLSMYKWGLIPSWSKDPAIGDRMINARSESLAEKPSFRNAYKRRRCLILSDGFYEWKQNPDLKSKQPMYIRLKDGKPFAFAGLWEVWISPDGTEVRSCTIITTQPNSLLETIHNRMPVILPTEAYNRWLAKEDQQPAQLDELLIPYPAAAMVAFPVSKMVNRPELDRPELVQPIDNR